MTSDLVLASFHHLLVLGLAVMLAAERVLLSLPPTKQTLHRLLRVDIGYGACAGLLLLVGVMRLHFGLRPTAFYLHNPWFWWKIGVFVLAALLSVLPTVAFLRWRRAMRGDPGFLPSAQAMAAMRRIVSVELVLLAAIFVLAAMMARYGMF